MATQIFSASLDPSDGAVYKGRPLDKQGAIRFRQQGYDVVVCGDDESENLRVAFYLEETAFPGEKHHWHRAHKQTAGPAALPHVQTEGRHGHTFYETARKKAK